MDDRTRIATLRDAYFTAIVSPDRKGCRKTLIKRKLGAKVGAVTLAQTARKTFGAR